MLLRALDVGSKGAMLLSICKLVTYCYTCLIAYKIKMCLQNHVSTWFACPQINFARQTFEQAIPVKHFNVKSSTKKKNNTVSKANLMEFSDCPYFPHSNILVNLRDKVLVIIIININLFITFRVSISNSHSFNTSF